jgi:putative hemolysin
MLAPILMSPLLFVYGELLPKNLFYRAPNYLLRVSAPLFLFFTCLLSPVAAVLWGMGRLLEQCLGQSPEKIRLTLARKELQQVLEDGLEAGILHPTQRHLGQSFFLVASKEIGEICTPLGRVKSLSVDATREAVMKFARQKRIADIPVYRTSRSELVGYVRTVDLMVNDSSSLADLMRPLSVVKMTELFGETILQMQSSRETLVSVANSHGKIVGLLSIDQLTDPLLNGPLGSLKR